MTTDAGFGPDAAPTVGHQTDVDTDSQTDDLQTVTGEDGTLDAEKEPLGGTGGASAGGAG